MKKVFYYIMGILMLLFSIYLFYAYNSEAFTLSGFALPLILFITGMIYIYLGKKQETSAPINISMGASVLLWLGVLYELFLFDIIFPQGGYGEFHLPILFYNILLIISFISAVSGLILYKNKR